MHEKQNMIKALFFDIDGTLVSINTHRIPHSTVIALTQAKAKGLKIFIATGRPFAIINNLKTIEHLIDGYVTANGAHCFIGKEVVYSHPIPKEYVNLLLEDSLKCDYSCIVVGEKDIATYNYKDNIDRIFRVQLNVTNIDYRLPVEHVLTQDILQLTPFITEEQEKEIMPRLSGCISGRWHPEFTDITSVMADKGKGITAMAQHIGIDLKECAAFGDGGNDLSMIRCAGMGVAMGNANQKLKAAADYVTTDIDEDGISQALRFLKITD